MTKRGKNGFSLIEVLVSILVLAVGVIGAAGMQLTALRTTYQSALQTSALHLAAEMADSIRSIDAKLVSTGGESPFQGVDFDAATGYPAAPARSCYASDCDPEALAEFNIYEWKSRVKELLPGGRMLICRDAAPWDNGKRSLTWNCSGSADGNAPLVVKLGWQAKNPDGSLVKDSGNSFPPSIALVVEPSS